jgi:uncharacterized membrane protein YhhN
MYLIWAAANFDVFGALKESVWALGAAVLLWSICFAALRRWWHELGTLKWPVTLYVGLSATLGTYAIAAATYASGMPFALGVGAFLLSDIILAEQLFKMKRDHPRYRMTSSALWAFYWLGQSGISIGVLVLFN